jgi:hypothetical protein
MLEKSKMIYSKAFVPIILILLFSGCSTLVKAPEPVIFNNDAEPLAGYARILKNFVNDRGEVDFQALQKNRSDLDRYIAFISKKKTNSITDSNDRLAHFINSYNALSMYNVLESEIPKSNAGTAKIRFFYLRRFLIGGTEMSLYEYENDVIRKLMEPRVHFALNCSALSCPILPKIPFSGVNLDKELERETYKFFSEQRNLRIDHAKKKVYLSELLDFYTDDFITKSNPTLISYINNYVQDKIPEVYTIEYIPYDWTIANSAR